MADLKKLLQAVRDLLVGRPLVRAYVPVPVRVDNRRQR